MLAAAGSAIVWTRSDGTDRDRWSAAATRHAGRAVTTITTRPVSPARLVVGTVFVATGIAGFIAVNEGVGAFGQLGLAVVATLAGMALLAGPWMWRLIVQLRAERRERIRQEERAELAAHLHDSVLQTLALIRRSGDQPRRMVALARRQERELRSWLYGQHQLGAPVDLTAAVEGVAEEVEAAHDLAVEAVVVGDAEVDDGLRALLSAVREACTNAAKHAGVDTVSVFVEADPRSVTASVRDRGAGFDPATVPGDRRGIRESILGRLERHGGHAELTSAPERGTEVELVLPRRGTGPHRKAGAVDDQPGRGARERAR